MPSLQVSLSGWEIATLEAEANEQMEAIVTEMKRIGKEIDWDKVPRIVASTIAAQVIRAALPALELKTAEAKRKRENMHTSAREAT